MHKYKIMARKKVDPAEKITLVKIWVKAKYVSRVKKEAEKLQKIYG